VRDGDQEDYRNKKNKVLKCIPSPFSLPAYVWTVQCIFRSKFK